MLGGILIAALGVLNDVTIRQASSVLALRRANPKQRFASYTAPQPKSDATISTRPSTPCVAYAGASLPLLLIFSS